MAGAARKYGFTLRGEDIDFAGNVDQRTAKSILDFVLGGESTRLPAAPAPGAEAQRPGTVLTRLSLREYLNVHTAKRIPEKITAIGEYLTTNGAADFSKDEVLAQFRIAREAMPGNFNRDFNWAIATGWIAEDGQNPGRFYVTQSGKQAVEGNFSGDLTKNSGIRAVRRKRRRS
jgi:hypothetical protein